MVDLAHMAYDCLNKGRERARFKSEKTCHCQVCRQRGIATEMITVSYPNTGSNSKFHVNCWKKKKFYNKIYTKRIVLYPEGICIY